MVNENILVVEDEGIVAMHIENSLKTLGYTVCGIATSGEESIEMAKNLSPDLVLMDIVLKGNIDGIEAAEHIRNKFDIPTIFLTAYGDESTLNRAKLTEPFGYLLKPFKERDLHIAIEIAIYKHSVEGRLKAVERFLSTILKSIGDAIITTDTRGCITYSNCVAEQLTGWDVEEVVNKNIADIFNLVNEQTHKSIEDPTPRVIRDIIEVVLDPYTVLISRNGKEIPVDGKVAPLKDDKGAFEGMIFIFRDITVRRRMERELWDSEERYRRLFETSKDGLLLLHKQTGHIINVNAAVVQMLGYPREEILGKKLNDIGLLKDIVDFQTIVHGLEEMGFMHFDYMPVKNKNGQDIDTEIYLMDRTGVIQCNVRDITRRKKAEEELNKHRWHLEEMVKERTAELERMNRLFVGREQRIIELKKKIAELEKKVKDRAGSSG